MANPLNESEDLDEEIDYNFFDDDFEDKSEKNNNALIENDKKEISYSNNKKKNSVEENMSNRSENLSFSEELEVSEENSSNSSKNSEKSSHRSSASISEAKSKHSSSPKISKSPVLSTRSQSSSAHSRNSLNESDVTTVSSLESEPQLKNTNNHKDYKQVKAIHVTHINDPEDIDRVQPEAILRAMIRIHDERRAMRHLRPKWVDPTTKDYSVSGISKKINLVPEKIVSMTKKNIRDNPFYFHYREPSRRPYHTAINREKELERIEKENRTIYDRLKQVKPSPGITKQQLLKEYTKVSRFSLPPNFRPYTANTKSSFSTFTATNSRSCSQNRQTHSSTSMHKSRSELESSHGSRRYSNGRVMSAGSLNSHQSRPSSVVDKRKMVKK